MQAQGGAVRFGVDIDEKRGRVTNLYCTNATGLSVRGAATLTNGSIHAQVFGQGDTALSLPTNAVPATFDAATGLWDYPNIARLELAVPA